MKTPPLKYFEKKCEPSGFPPQAIESLEMSIAYSSTQDLLNVFQTLGVRTIVPQVGPSASEWGQESPLNLIAGHSIEQPGHCEIFGVKIAIWCSNGRITVSASPTAYDVTEEHYSNAAIIEANIDKHVARIRSGES
ncbi:hypothetical protein [Pseudoduganella violaceinigra]|uniref:hypothetical protein n=1 Tax=Pseudoduganella violaceinigra TaxID=246602 RepID=UPI000558BE50|nr:hypothetical protein [Pseudoduganella violaceinigra]